MITLATTLLLLAAATPCATPADVRRDVAEMLPPATIAGLEGRALQTFLDDLNALPPQSSIRAETAVVVTREANPVVLLVTFRGGCATFTYTLPKTMFEALMDKGRV